MVKESAIAIERHEDTLFDPRDIWRVVFQSDKIDIVNLLFLSLPNKGLGFKLISLWIYIQVYEYQLNYAKFATKSYHKCTSILIIINSSNSFRYYISLAVKKLFVCYTLMMLLLLWLI